MLQSDGCGPISDYFGRYGARISGTTDPHEITGIYDLEYVGAVDTKNEEYVKVGGGGRIVWHASVGSPACSARVVNQL